jgi:hypothetical protein
MIHTISEMIKALKKVTCGEKKYIMQRRSAKFGDSDDKTTGCKEIKQKLNYLKLRVVNSIRTKLIKYILHI